MEPVEFLGIVLFQRPYKDRDALLKIFTRSKGKRMFFVKNLKSPNHFLKRACFPMARATYIGQINAHGFSFLNEVKTCYFPKQVQVDIEANAYASYLAHLVDASLEEGEVDEGLFDKLWQALEKIEEGNDSMVIANILEVQLLPKFGVDPHLKSCVFCQKDQGIFDYSVRYDGLICQDHFSRDPKRSHWSARAAHFIRIFSQLDYEAIQSISLNGKTKREIRQAIDSLYQEYVGLSLKSKSFIDKLINFDNPLDDSYSSKV
ncbi:DNA repair protein RecO [Aerococcus christensenii]|uniref:DNA repair protein RecO n=1 Tax=Aerococcus christensenii TaxID=87541 RepID=UPI0023A92AB6|nr:DNA repair protein RecO [Aerococcus christensenii]WEB70310.1 DNA repair protein RecO [Aerococcus christensenii]